MLISETDYQRRIRECDEALATAILPNVRERLERAKKAWEAMLEKDQIMQNRREMIRQARLVPPV